jgi:prepilin-type processing-associated H-X9-DG protein
MVEPYLKNPLAWVCPKRKRGMSFTTVAGSFDPSITGFLSYGFNEIGCFCLADPTNGTMPVPTPPFKLTLARQPSQLLCITEVSGSDNPDDCDGNGGNSNISGDAAWLDNEWGANSGPGPFYDMAGFDGRLQTAYAKHNNRVNVLYVDGHTELTLVSRLTWSVFWGIYGPPPNWPTMGVPANHQWNAPISSTSYDTQVWSNMPE